MQPADGGAGFFSCADGGAGFFFSCADAIGAAKSTTVAEPTIIAMANAICFTILIYRSQANSNDPAKVKASMSSARWATSLDGSGAVLLRREERAETASEVAATTVHDPKLLL